MFSRYHSWKETRCSIRTQDRHCNSHYMRRRKCATAIYKSAKKLFELLPACPLLALLLVTGGWGKKSKSNTWRVNALQVSYHNWCRAADNLLDSASTCPERKAWRDVNEGKKIIASPRITTCLWHFPINLTHLCYPHPCHHRRYLTQLLDLYYFLNLLIYRPNPRAAWK